MRIVPTQDAAKLGAAKGVFTRYATEAVSFYDLAKWLNRTGVRNSFGNKFQSNDVRKMLSDEAYLGYPTFRKRRTGRFKRFDSEGGVVDLEPELKGKDTASAPEDVIRSTVKHYPPPVDRSTWDAVQKKLSGREKKVGYAPKSAALYLAGLVVCAGCGAPMLARTDRMEYTCGTRDKHRVRGEIKDSPCERNGVRQDVLEEHITRYLEEVGKRVDVLTQGEGADLSGVDRQIAEESRCWWEFQLGFEEIKTYLMKHHATEYHALVRESHAEDTHPEWFVTACS